jgi:hypothetical protein
MELQRSRSAKITKFVGDNEYVLRLRIEELIALQEALNVGPYFLSQRLVAGNWFVEDVTQTIRLGLIGGGMRHEEAAKLIRNYVKEGYLSDYYLCAYEVLMAALIGVADEEEEATGEDPLVTAASGD